MEAIGPDPRSKGARAPFGRWQEVTIIASGPSLTRDDCERVREWRDAGGGRAVIVVNLSFRLARWADVLYAADVEWWRQHHLEALQFQGEKWTCTGEPARIHGINRCEARFGQGLCRDPRYLNTGGNSGYQAINLAYHFGARRIILIGYDMQHTGGLKHWHSDYPEGMDNATPVASWRRRFEPLARDLKHDGVRVINATRQTALECFERMPLEDALCGH